MHYDIARILGGPSTNTYSIVLSIREVSTIENIPKKK